MHPAIVFWTLSSLVQAIPVPRYDVAPTQTNSEISARHIDEPYDISASTRTSKRSDQSWMSEGSAGFIDIMMPVPESSGSERVASIVLSASTATASENEDDDGGVEKSPSFILNASNTTRTRLYLIVSNSSSSTPLASESLDESVLEVFLKFPIFDTQSADTVAYCATFDPKASAASTSISVEKCRDPDSDVSCQTFTYNTLSGVVSPKWMDDTLDRSRIEIQSNNSTSPADSMSNSTNISNSTDSFNSTGSFNPTVSSNSAGSFNMTDSFNSTLPDLDLTGAASNSSTLPMHQPGSLPSTSSDADSDASKPYDDGMYHPDPVFDDGMYHSQDSKRDVKVSSEALIGEDQDAVVLVFTPMNFTEAVASSTPVDIPSPSPTSSDQPDEFQPTSSSKSSMPIPSKSSYPFPTGIEKMDNSPVLSSASAANYSQKPQRSTKVCNKRKSKHPRQSSMSPPVARINTASSSSIRLDEDTHPVESDESTMTSSSSKEKPTIEWFIEAPAGSPTAKATATASASSK